MDVLVCNNEESFISEKTYQQVAKFDRYQKDRILNLMLLKTNCIERDNALRNAYSFHGVASSFFTAIVGAADCLLFAQINEEATACLENGGPIGELLASVVEDARCSGIPLERIQFALEDMQSLFRDRGAYVHGSTYLDFIVTTYSAFEFYMAKIYDAIRLKHPSSGSKLKKLKKVIKKYNEAAEKDKDKILEDIAKINNYVSGREKIEFILSKLPERSQGDRVRDLLAVQFYSNTRNSIHNLGISGSQVNSQCSLGERKLAHNVGEPLFTEDRSDIVRLCQELVNIYAYVVEENKGFVSEFFSDVASGFFEDEPEISS